MIQWKNMIISILLIAVYISSIFTTVAESQNVNFDERGIPVVDYGYVSPKGASSPNKVDNWIYLGVQMNPLTVASQGNDYYKQYIYGGNNLSRDKFLNCSDWLVENAVKKEGYLVWESNFSWPTYNNTAPFISGMTQGLAIELLTNAYNYTKNEKYINYAKEGLNAFSIDINEGGVTYKDANGWWYEEYAQPNMNIQPRVLNGHIFALLGIYKYYEITGDEQAKYIFDMGTTDLKAYLADFDNKQLQWTNYDLVGNRATSGYHNIHIDQLGKMYNITGSSIFDLYRNKWANYSQLQTKQNEVGQLELIKPKIMEELSKSLLENNKNKVKPLEQGLTKIESDIKKKNDELSFIRGNISKLNESITQLSLNPEEEDINNKGWWQFWK